MVWTLSLGASKQKVLNISFDSVLSTAAYIILGIYYAFILLAIKGWRTALKQSIESVEDRSFTGLSILIPFRNEAENLAELVRYFNDRTIRQDMIQLIFINDHSSDNGVDVLKALDSQHDRKLLENQGAGKKDALLTGLRHARHEFVLTIDADIRPSDKWLEMVIMNTGEKGADMLILPVIPTFSRGFIQRFSTLDQWSLFGMTHAFTALHRPIMASGANLLFKRSLHSAEGNEVASGDDMFLLHEFKERKASISQTVQMGSEVMVDNPNDFASFWSQRKRWAAKSASYTDKETLGVAWLVLLTNLVLVILVFAGLFSLHYAYIALSCWLLKFIADLVFLRQVTGHYERSSDLVFFQ